MDSDMRKFPRKAYEGKVKVVEHINGKTSTAFAVDINPMGIFIETTRQYMLGDPLTLSFLSPTGEYIVQITGEVVRVVDCDEARRKGAAQGIGVEFFDVPEYVFDDLCNYVYEGDDDIAILLRPAHNTAEAFAAA